MAAISKAWVTIADGAVDPDSPGTTTLFTGIRDDLIHLREWLGNSFTAGAVQDHNHDGSNSALVPVGPNLVRNASFEQDTSGWTITTFTGGSSAVETANDAHGAKSLSFTSTVLANGGGEALSNEFIPCGGSVGMRFEVWHKGSVANIASKAETVWYDDAQAQISLSSIYTDTTTPTTATRARVTITSPAGARFFRIKLTGGTPGAGTATGTIYFDGLNASDWTIIQSFIDASAVGQGELKTTTGEVTANSSGQLLTLPGGTYGFYPQIRADSSSANLAKALIGGNEEFTQANWGTTYLTRIVLGSGAGNIVRAQQRYIQASPPYDLGDGDVPLFVFAVLDNGNGAVLSTYVAPDPPWANNGPTIINPLGRIVKLAKTADKFRDAAIGAGRRAAYFTALQQAKAMLESPDPAVQAQMLAILQAPTSQEEKQRDMPLIPHPFQGNDMTGKTIVLLDPVGSICEELWLAREFGGDSVTEILHGEYLQIDNTPLSRAAPPGVIPVAANWKLT